MKLFLKPTFKQYFCFPGYIMPLIPESLWFYDTYPLVLRDISLYKNFLLFLLCLNQLPVYLSAFHLQNFVDIFYVLSSPIPFTPSGLCTVITLVLEGKRANKKLPKIFSKTFPLGVSLRVPRSLLISNNFELKFQYRPKSKLER